MRFFRILTHRAAAVGALLAAVACGKDTTAPPKATSLTVSVSGTITGKVNTAVTPTPTFTVLDEKGSAMANVPVTVSVSGGGSVVSAAKTSTSGSTPVGTWTLGSTPGPNTLTITVAGLTPVTITATARPAYYVDLRFFGPTIDPAIQTAFTNAKSRIEAMITTSLPDTPVSGLSIEACDVTGGGSVTETIDDIIIYATVKPIDGVGKVVGSSAPCYVRTTGGLPLIAVMSFDVADFQNLQADGRLPDVVLHEMLHAVGVGTLWNSKGQVAFRTTDSTQFIGPQAVQGCLFHGGAAKCPGNVPVENTGVVAGGTRDVHWRETTFRTELMTGFVSAAGTPNPLSRITIGSLTDIGYTVTLAVADSYTVPALFAASAQLLGAATGHPPLELIEPLRAPIGAVDAKGRVTRLSARWQ
jgi:hypothetical protein